MSRIKPQETNKVRDIATLTFEWVQTPADGYLPWVTEYHGVIKATRKSQEQGDTKNTAGQASSGTQRRGRLMMTDNTIRYRVGSPNRSTARFAASCCMNSRQTRPVRAFSMANSSGP
jgi:hypothetical protein